MKEQILEVQTGRMGLQKKIDAVQGDSGRVLKCIVTDMQIPSGSIARIYAVKPSGAEIYNNCIVSGLAVLVELTTQMLAEVGVTYCQVQITQSGKTVTSFEFNFDVKRSLASSGSIESTNEFNALETAVWQAQQFYSPEFAEATSRANISSGETIPTLFGKIKKWFTDLGTSAFCTVVNNATTTIANTVLDGRMGKTFMDKFDELNRNINRSTYISVPKDAAVNVIFAVSVQSGRCPIVIYGTAAGTIPFAFIVPFNTPVSTLTALEKAYMIKDSSLDSLNLSIIAESGNYRLKFTNNTGNGLDMYITIGHSSAHVIKVS